MYTSYQLQFSQKDKPIASLVILKEIYASSSNVNALMNMCIVYRHLNEEEHEIEILYMLLACKDTQVPYNRTALRIATLLPALDAIQFIQQLPPIDELKNGQSMPSLDDDSSDIHVLAILQQLYSLLLDDGRHDDLLPLQHYNDPVLLLYKSESLLNRFLSKQHKGTIVSDIKALELSFELLKTLIFIQPFRERKRKRSDLNGSIVDLVTSVTPLSNKCIDIPTHELDALMVRPFMFTFTKRHAA